MTKKLGNVVSASLTFDGPKLHSMSDEWQKLSAKVREVQLFIKELDDKHPEASQQLQHMLDICLTPEILDLSL